MSVATQLGLADPAKELLGQVREAWPRWCEQLPDLRVVEDLLDLPAWIQAADRQSSDDVLHQLAELASPTGGDDVTAAGALAWLLLPGACVMAHRLRTLTNRIDEVVAAQLWLEVRSFPWQRQRKVAANIVMNTRRGVLRELGVGRSARDADPAWARSFPASPDSALWGSVQARQHPQLPDPSSELADVLAWAMEHEFIDEAHRDLLLALAVTADEKGVSHNGRGRGGMCSHAVTSSVADHMGVSPITIRRRATASLRALAQAVTSSQIPA
jgi:hypothetical protein